MPNLFSPAVVEGETASELWLERSLLSGDYLAAVAYGIHLAVFCICAYFLTCKPAHGKISWLFVGYVSILVASGTINVASTIHFMQMAWIDNRDMPGGPAAYNVEMYNILVQKLGNSAYIVANFLAGGFLIWCCFAVYERCYWVVIIPALSFVASTVLSIILVYQGMQPVASVWSQSDVVIAIPFWSLSIILNLVVSTMIVACLLWHHQVIRKTLGPQHGTIYLSIAAIAIESAAIYSITGLIFIICHARSSNMQNLFIGILGQVECIAPELIVLRVALGRAWLPKTPRGGATEIILNTDLNTDGSLGKIGTIQSVVGRIHDPQTAEDCSNVV